MPCTSGGQRRLRMPGEFDLQRGSAVGAQALRQLVGHDCGLGLFILAFVVVRVIFAAETLTQAFQVCVTLWLRPRASIRDASTTCAVDGLSVTMAPAAALTFVL